MVEIQRVAEFRKLTAHAQPSNFPTNPALADHCAIAIMQAKADPASFVRAVGEALWTHDLQIADEAVMADLLGSTGHDANAVLKAAKEDGTADIRMANSKDAIAADAIGAPAYVYQGEVFWGQDRLEYLDYMLASGRSGFTA